MTGQGRHGKNYFLSIHKKSFVIEGWGGGWLWGNIALIAISFDISQVSLGRGSESIIGETWRGNQLYNLGLNNT